MLAPGDLAAWSACPPQEAQCCLECSMPLQPAGVLRQWIVCRCNRCMLMWFVRQPSCACQPTAHIVSHYDSSCAATRCRQLRAVLWRPCVCAPQLQRASCYIPHSHTMRQTAKLKPHAPPVTCPTPAHLLRRLAGAGIGRPPGGRGRILLLTARPSDQPYPNCQVPDLSQPPASCRRTCCGDSPAPT